MKHRLVYSLMALLWVAAVTVYVFSGSVTKRSDASGPQPGLTAAAVTSQIERTLVKAEPTRKTHPSNSGVGTSIGSSNIGSSKVNALLEALDFPKLAEAGVETE